MRGDAIERRRVCGLQKKRSNATDDGDHTAVDLPNRRERTEETLILTYSDRFDPIGLSIFRTRDHFAESIR